MLKTFGGSIGFTAVALGIALVYGGPTGLAVAAILAVLEVSLSFDNAVVNATVLGKMSAFWQKIFLTFGVAIAVFGMRMAFPLLIVGITAKLSPSDSIHLALAKGDVHTPGSYGYLLREAHPAIAAFGGVFLLLLFLDFIFEERELTWLSWLERPLARIGKLDQLSVVVVLVGLVVAADVFAPAGTAVSVLVSGALGTVTYILVNGLGELLDADEDEDADEPSSGRAAGQIALKVGKAAFVSFLYLEVLDASFSFDGVIGAFAITSDPIIIALGLGIGAMFIRSLTVFLVRKGTLSEYVYLEHGAQWAIGALAVLLLCTIKFEVPEVVTGLIGVGFIGAALVSSIVRNKRNPEGRGDNDDSLADLEPVAV
jgi:hypothetical protein